MTAYRDIPFWPWALALAVTAVPAFFLPPKTAGAYVAIVLIGYAVFNADDLARLTSFVQAKVKQ